ncbi:MAG: hypothetical protein ACREFE_13960, partial [Limisphaerales bacterium]
TRWFEEHRARQKALREKFRQIAAPAGLKEQIISEQTAQEKIIFRRHTFELAAAAVVVGLILLAPFWFRPQKNNDNTFATFENRMAGIALRGYDMDLTTNNPAQIRAYLAQNRAPADYVLPAGLQKITTTGCAVENWQGAKVSMICFRTGKPLPPGEQNDVWLFVSDYAAVNGAPAESSPHISKINRLTTATWTQNGKLYLLGIESDEQTIRKFL